MKALLFLLLAYSWYPVIHANACGDPCAGHPCMNHGICNFNRHTCSYTCACQQNFGGHICQHRLRCAPNVCNMNEDCVVRNNQAYCVCKQGRIGNPITGCTVNVRKACIHGDPHFDTFDGYKSSYHGTCPVILSQNRKKIPDFPDFQILGINRLLSPSSKLAWLGDMEMTIYEQKLSFLPGNLFQHNGITTNTPFYWPNENYQKIKVSYNGLRFTIETEHNLQVIYQWSHACILVPDVPSLKGENTLMGLFGNIDDNWSNDMVCKDGSKITAEGNNHDPSFRFSEKYVKCQDSYITTHTFSECVTGLTLLKKHEQCNAATHASSCAPIKQAVTGKGFFGACQKLGETIIHEEYQDCILAMCGSVTNKCTAFTSFATRCSRALSAGDSIGPWRNSTGCMMQCGPNSVYNYCSSACPRTCANLEFQETCTQNCNEKCECMPGYIVDNTQPSSVKCIRVEECGCKGPQGQWHTANKNFLNDRCNLYSGCYGGKYVSKSIECSPDATCTAKNGIRQCLCNSGFVGDGFTCGVKTNTGNIVTAIAPQCNICASYPCKNGGTCVPDLTDSCHKYRCECQNNFYGDNCEVKPECKKESCANNAECKIENSKILCICPRAHAGDPYVRGCVPYVRSCIVMNKYNSVSYFSSHFYGTCPVLVFRNKVKLQHYDDFEVIARQHSFNGASTLTSIKEAEVTIANQTILIESQQRIFLNGRQITAPYYYPNEKNVKFTIEVTYWSVVVKVPNSYIVVMGEKEGLCVSIPVDADFQNKNVFDGIGGNVGSPPGVVCRDGKFVSPPTSEEEEINVVNCIDSWIEPMKTKYKNEKCVNGNTIHGITSTKMDECNSTRTHAECSIIKDVHDGSGVFANCNIMGHYAVDQFYEDCSLALCLDSSSKCDMLAGFAAACSNELHHSVGNWRNTAGCPPLVCNEPNSEYKECASQCQDTCAQRNRDTCNKGCREGCVCKPGFIIDNTVTDRLACIQESECGCADQDGKWYHAGSEWLSNECRSSNKCKNGILSTKRNECGDNAHCNIVEDGSQTCKCSEGYKGDGYTCNEIVEERITRATRPPKKTYDACSNEPCNNGGTCMLVDNDPYIRFRCKCPSTHGGAFCDDLVEQCNGIVCDNNAKCIKEGRTESCKCSTGYSGDGQTCILIKDENKVTRATRPPKKVYDACSNKPCNNGGQCILVDNDPYIRFRCTCPKTHTGAFCDDLVKLCGESACDKNAYCDGTGDAATCKCNNGYKGNGITCIVSEDTASSPSPNVAPTAATEHNRCNEAPCQNGGTCVPDNKEPSIRFTCTCPKNFGGPVCDYTVEECDGVKCSRNGHCAKVGGNSVCKCNKGYTGSGQLCSEIKEDKVTLPPKHGEHDICATEPCKNGGTCIRDKDDPGNNFACKCPSNFGGSLCDDLLECTEDTCGENAKCTVMNNKVDCVCKKGYAGNPFKACGKIRSACVAQDPHIKTFDGLEVDYHGTCPYVFTSSCGKSVDTYTPFQAVLKNHLSDGEGERYLSWVYEAEIELFNQTVHMDMYSEELTVNQVKQNPPFYWPNQDNPKITILFRARTYGIKTNDGIEFTFGNYKFCANLPEVAGFKNPSSLCGIAGNIDDKWENDVVWRNGSILKLDKQDYKFDFSYPELQKCQDTWMTTMKTIKRDHKKCQTAETLGRLYMNSSCDVDVPTKLCLPIKQAQSRSGPFAMCSVMGDHAIEGLYQDCIVETCPNITHLCREFKVMASACRDALPQDTDMGNWRKETECPMECPANSVYSTCKSACPETCAENGKPTCDKGCVEGCQCNPGYVLDNTVSEAVKCIKKEDCGCTDQNGNWHRATRPFLTNNCQFINQCENGSLIEKSHKCGKNSLCVTADSLMQCDCKYGFAGDGYTCSEVTVTEQKPGVPVTCYPGWKYFKLMNKCYKNYDETMVTFEEGRRICARNSAEPVSINIKEELDFIIEKFGQPSDEKPSSSWVGMQLKSGTWEWFDGTKATNVQWSTKASKIKECAQLRVQSTGSEYLDMECDSKASVICEALPIMSSVCES